MVRASSAESATHVLIVPTDEELAIARDTHRLVASK
jgi:acetate kinase